MAEIVVNFKSRSTAGCGGYLKIDDKVVKLKRTGENGLLRFEVAPGKHRIAYDKTDSFKKLVTATGVSATALPMTVDDFLTGVADNGLRIKCIVLEFEQNSVLGLEITSSGVLSFMRDFRVVDFKNMTSHSSPAAAPQKPAVPITPVKTVTPTFVPEPPITTFEQDTKKAKAANKPQSDSGNRKVLAALIAVLALCAVAAIALTYAPSLRRSIPVFNEQKQSQTTAGGTVAKTTASPATSAPTTAAQTTAARTTAARTTAAQTTAAQTTVTRRTDERVVKGYVATNESPLTVRRRPDSDSSAIGYFEKGAEVEIIGGTENTDEDGYGITFIYCRGIGDEGEELEGYCRLKYVKTYD